MIDWKTVTEKCQNAAEADDWNGFWEIQSKTALEIANKIFDDVNGVPEICQPIVLAALYAVRDAIQAGSDKEQKGMQIAAAKFIQQALVPTVTKVPSSVLRKEADAPAACEGGGPAE